MSSSLKQLTLGNDRSYREIRSRIVQAPDSWLVEESCLGGERRSAQAVWIVRRFTDFVDRAWLRTEAKDDEAWKHLVDVTLEIESQEVLHIKRVQLLCAKARSPGYLEIPMPEGLIDDVMKSTLRLVVKARFAPTQAQHNVHLMLECRYCSQPVTTTMTPRDDTRPMRALHFEGYWSQVVSWTKDRPNHVLVLKRGTAIKQVELQFLDRSTGKRLACPFDRLELSVTDDALQVPLLDMSTPNDWQLESAGSRFTLTFSPVQGFTACSAACCDAFVLKGNAGLRLATTLAGDVDANHLQNCLDIVVLMVLDHFWDPTA